MRRGSVPMKRKVIYVFITLFIVVLTLSSNFKAQASVEDQIHKNIINIQQSISDSASTPLALSSSPYTYIKDSKDFDNIVALGNPALPVLKKLLDQSKDNGLIEYIYAIAIEKISKMDIRKETNWDNAKDFSKKYTTHLKKIPDQVEVISKEKISSDEKNEKLIKLGTPAIPYIADKIENGDNELFPALDL